jgi:hypothetical protein
MKYLLIISAFFLSGCTCLISQPPQFIIAGPNCTAPLPDYRTSVTVTGGCTGFILTQTPAAGTMLTQINKVANVTIKATGTNNKSSQITFTVTMIDTITPKITPMGILAVEQVNKIYDIADNMVNKINKDFEAIFPYDNLGLNQIIDSSFYKKLLIVVSMDSMNYRKRFITFADSLITY